MDTKTKYEIYKNIAQTETENNTGLVELGVGSLILILSMFVAPVIGTVAGGILGFLYIKKSLDDGETNTKAIKNKGIISPFLKKDDLMGYVETVGEKQVRLEWEKAKELGLKVGKLDSKVFQFSKTIDVVGSVVPETESIQRDIDDFVPAFETADRMVVRDDDELEIETNKTIGAYQRLIEDGKSIAVYAPSGRGKTVFVRELIDGMRASSPNMVLVAIDPKGIKGESQFWDTGVFDSVTRINKNLDLEIRANMIYSALKRYKKISIDAMKSGRKFVFLLDECIITTLTINGSMIKDEVELFIKDWMGGIVTAGHATQQSIILMTQTSQNESLPIPTYLRNQLTGIIIAAKPQADLNTCNNCNPKIVPNNKSSIFEIQSVIDVSSRMMVKASRPPKGRAIFITTENQWFPVYPIEIKGTDRDLGNFNNEDEGEGSPEAPIEKLEVPLETGEVDDNEDGTVNPTGFNPPGFNVIVDEGGIVSQPQLPDPDPDPIPTSPPIPDPILPIELELAIAEATVGWKPSTWIYDKVTKGVKQSEAGVMNRPEFRENVLDVLVNQGKLLQTSNKKQGGSHTYYKWKSEGGYRG